MWYNKKQVDDNVDDCHLTVTQTLVNNSFKVLFCFRCQSYEPRTVKIRSVEEYAVPRLRKDVSDLLLSMYQSEPHLLTNQKASFSSSGRGELIFLLHHHFRSNAFLW